MPTIRFVMLFVPVFFSGLLFGQSVLTQGYGNSRTGANTAERILSATRVNYTSFGHLADLSVDGMVIAQPLLVTGVSISGATNVLVIATQYNWVTTSGGCSIYLFNADPPWNQIWRVNLCTSYTGSPGDGGFNATPVIDPSTNVIYAVGEDNTPNYKLYALNLADGSTYAGPTTLTATGFVPANQQVRTGLLDIGGSIYAAASAGGSSSELTSGAAGFVFQFDKTALTQTRYVATAVSNLSGNGPAGIWQGGGGIAVDSSGNLQITSGNGPYDGGSSCSVNCGESRLAYNTSLAIQNQYTPANWAALNAADEDISSGQIIVSGTHVLFGGKDGRIFVDCSGGLGGAGGTCGQIVTTGVPVTPSAGTNVNYVIGDSYLYTVSSNTGATSFTWNGSTLGSTATAVTSLTWPQQAAHLTYSSNAGAAGSGILWVWAAQLALNGNLTQYQRVGTLYAYDPVTLTLLWSYASTGAVSKFTMPTVANGKVYVPTASTNIVQVYGLANLSIAMPSSGVAW